MARGAWRANSPWGRKVLETTKRLALSLFFFFFTSIGKESTCQCRRHRKLELDPLGHEDSLEKEMATHSSILAWEIHGEGSLVGYSPWDHKESNMT